MKPAFLPALALATSLALPAAPVFASVERPTVKHAGQWWTNSKGCRYSRAGAPGETMWFLIVNTAKKGCPTYITGKSASGMYADVGPKV